MTRRIVKISIPVSPIASIGYTAFTPPGHISIRGDFWKDGERRFGEWFMKCPYGQPGDRLWVRETWAPADKILFGSDLDECEAVAYKADGSILDPNGQHFNAFGIDFSKIRWKPSIHMRRDYSRILLEITDIRVERLQEISEQDAIAEGIEISPVWKGPGDVYPSDPVKDFCTLWESIHGPESWDANPWVWVVSFKKI